MDGLIRIIPGDMARLIGMQVAAVAAAANMGSPVTVAVVGVVAIAVDLGLLTLFVRKLDEYNSTLREIEERHEREERVNQRRRVAEATEEEALSIMGVEDALAEAHKAKEALLKGIRPVVMPTRAQVSAAKQRFVYSPAKFHFAVCGTAGGGKSSLINAFRGLKPRDEFAAKVGVTECTSEVTRYPDPRNVIPYSLFVWYDIPGAGTINVPDWQYFNDQGLFVFDFIVIVYDVRFTKIDEGIITNCLLFEIPFFLVRSKADQHIQNMKNDMDEKCEHEKVVDKYVKDTRADLRMNLEKMAKAPELDARAQQLLLNQRVYIVSGSTLRDLFQETTSEQTRRNLSQSRIIDEKLLIKDMLKQAASRRCPGYPDILTEDAEGVHAVTEKNTSSDAKPAGLMIDPKASENDDHRNEEHVKVQRE